MYLKPRIAPRGVKRKLVFNVRQETNAPVEETPCAPAVVKLRTLANYTLCGQRCPNLFLKTYFRTKATPVYTK